LSAFSQIFLLPIANIVLESAAERIFVKEKYADVPLGLFLVRGDNLFLVGELVSSF
tara:strand:+ start:3850 stop:4017 length:168 start_codon:yes stop_codon:yes gene_type:complete